MASLHICSCGASACTGSPLQEIAGPSEDIETEGELQTSHRPNLGVFIYFRDPTCMHNLDERDKHTCIRFVFVMGTFGITVILQLFTKVTFQEHSI